MDMSWRCILPVSVASAIFLCSSVFYARPDSGPHIRKAEPPRLTTSGRSAAERAILEKHHRADRTVLRVRPDSGRTRLWVLTLDHVHVYDTHTLELMRTIPLPEWFVADFMCAPDLIVDRSGTAFVSNNVQPRLVQIDGDDFRVTDHQLRLISAKQWDVGFGALALGADGTLFGLSALAGSLFRIDLQLGTATEIESPQMDAALAAIAVNLRAGCSPL
jgi:hypothetical protein